MFVVFLFDLKIIEPCFQYFFDELYTKPSNSVNATLFLWLAVHVNVKTIKNKVTKSPFTPSRPSFPV